MENKNFNTNEPKKNNTSNFNTFNLKRETKVLLRKLKLSLFISILIILILYSLIDIYVFHKGDLSKTILKLNFHEFWVYSIILIFFIIIFVFSKFIIKKQVNFETSIRDSEERYLRLIEGAKDLFSSSMIIQP